ncbi:glycoside hydrolase family 18 protein [Heterobasidion irregulare TC 32-1]|uniref:Glycoside hydrolase family 18 protein n=1 Tax=Heterobasidion irregulare (strain TC 32-1) TaxID=747525 RepID=W4JX37_HETIT|nr:glycoside hydrolase family 18 protein [Heterobasidion irregulare TC 32-1]ETW78118.1 glycoside hydrolase family 18 protein [Heterobasidion irregulare TC 32-1]
MGPYDLLISEALLLSAHAQSVFAYDNSRYDNDDAIDVIPVAFVNTSFGPGGLPSMNLANTCNPTQNTTFSGSSRPDCSALASDIEYCQSKGKIVTLSLGDDSQAVSFADTIFNFFLGGSSFTRPFGSAVLGGVELYIEGTSSSGYAAFVNEIGSHAVGASKQYYISASPGCEYPDASLGAILNAASFDAVYVQFYIPCGLQNFDTTSDWDFGLWDYWARNVSPNPDVKIYIGAPASSTAVGGGGYQNLNTLSNYSTQMRKAFPSFGGVALWDASQAYVNDRYDLAIKNSLTAAGGTGFSLLTCFAPAVSACSQGNSGGNCAGTPVWMSSVAYTGGQQVSYSGHL